MAARQTEAALCCPVEYDRDLVVPLSAESILMEGARILDEWPMVEQAMQAKQSSLDTAQSVFKR